MWHGLAKLRLHTESTVKALEASTTQLGESLQAFESVTCTAFITRHLPSENAACGHCTAALASKWTHPPSRAWKTTLSVCKECKFNLATYKTHALGDVARAIRMYGTTDSYNTEVVCPGLILC